MKHRRDTTLGALIRCCERRDGCKRCPREVECSALLRGVASPLALRDELGEVVIDLQGRTLEELWLEYRKMRKEPCTCALCEGDNPACKLTPVCNALCALGVDLSVLYRLDEMDRW